MAEALYTSLGWDQRKLVSRKVTYPFAAEGYDQHRKIVEVYHIPKTAFDGLRRLDRANDTDPDTFLVDPGQPRLVDGGASYEVEEIYMNLPETRVTARSESWERPGVSGSATLTSGSIIELSTKNASEVEITLTDASSFIVGDLLFIQLQKNDPNTGSTTHYGVSAEITDKSGNTITVKPQGGSNQFFNATVNGINKFSALPARASKTIDVTAQVVHRYIQTTEPWTEDRKELFELRASDGEVTDILTSTTDPSTSTWAKWISGKRQIQIRNTEGPFRYAGNIWEFRDVLVFAQ